MTQELVVQGEQYLRSLIRNGSQVSSLLTDSEGRVQARTRLDDEHFKTYYELAPHQTVYSPPLRNHCPQLPSHQLQEIPHDRFGC